MLCGEYAVLLGAPAVCAAVERATSPGRATAALTGGAATPLSRAVARAALAHAGLPAAGAPALARALCADTSAFRLGGVKLGLGSSAAAAAALSAAALAALGARADAAAVLAVALDAHAAVSPGGSGADVAAVVHGGLVRVERGAAARAVTLPPGVELRFFFSGGAARTSPLVRRVLARADEAAVAGALETIAGAARRFLRGCDRGGPGPLLDAVRAHAAGLGELAAAAGVRIWTPPLRALSAIAARHGGAAKPSGAGGGDVAVAFAPSRAAADAIERDAAGAGLLPLALRIGAPGVRVEPPIVGRSDRRGAGAPAPEHPPLAGRQDEATEELRSG
jgi:phosphomevalonate kinase